MQVILYRFVVRICSCDFLPLHFCDSCLIVIRKSFPYSCFQCLLLRVNFAKLKLVLQDIEFQTLHCEFPNNFHFGRLELRSAWSPFCELNEVSKKSLFKYKFRSTWFDSFPSSSAIAFAQSPSAISNTYNNSGLIPRSSQDEMNGLSSHSILKSLA